MADAKYGDPREANSNDATYDELKSWIRPISYDEHNNWSTEYLLGMPLLPNHLEDGLSQFELEFDA